MKGRSSIFYFLTPVWGEPYTRLFVDTVIPSQLAGGNLAAFHGEPGHRYIIYTRPQDAEIIRSSAAYASLNECVPVTVEFITERINLVHDMMTDCYRRGIAEANRADAAAIFLTPDIVFSAGSFQEIKRISDDGWDVIYIPAIRTMKKAIGAKLANSFQQGNVIEIPSRQLMRIALDNLHPLADASWWEEGEGGLLPATIYWRVEDEGIVARCFHLHPVCVYPQRKGVTFFGTVDDDYVPAACPDSSRDIVVNDSDQLLAIELSDPVGTSSRGSPKGRSPTPHAGPSNTRTRGIEGCSGLESGCTPAFSNRKNGWKRKGGRARWLTTSRVISDGLPGACCLMPIFW